MVKYYKISKVGVMLAKFILFLTLFSQLYSNPILNKTYYTKSNKVMLSDIVTNVKKDTQLFQIEKYRHSKKISSKKLIVLLKKYGYDNYKSKYRFVKFAKKSDIDISKIKKSIKNFYHEHYKNIKIKNIMIEPRGYIETLPKKYSIHIPSRSYLSNVGTINIKTLQNKKFFFDYTLDATINSFIARKNIKRGTELTPFNTKEVNIVLSKVRATPIQVIHKTTLQARNHIKKDKILTIRDVVILDVVKRNSMVVVVLNNSNISITFNAKALQNGKNGDIINIQKTNGKRLKARVIGRNRVEIQ